MLAQWPNFAFRLFPESHFCCRTAGINCVELQAQPLSPKVGQSAQVEGFDAPRETRQFESVSSDQIRSASKLEKPWAHNANRPEDARNA
ncbi:hypothetical protein [Roseovarius sp. D0-M9]|uniref:hypothetical protein n=1 Tax=Roseovarius sp. D0-M9 TaxID=3127117 RepID=UPI00301008D0